MFFFVWYYVDLGSEPWALEALKSKEQKKIFRENDCIDITEDADFEKLKNPKIKIERKVEHEPIERAEEILQVEKITPSDEAVSKKKRKKNLLKAMKPRKYGKLHYIYQSYR